jgi:hypothetical protein
MTYATRDKAVKAIEAKGFVYERPSMMGAASFRMGSAYAWITEVWSPKHGKYRFQANMAGV